MSQPCMSLSILSPIKRSPTLSGSLNVLLKPISFFLPCFFLIWVSFFTFCDLWKSHSTLNWLVAKAFSFYFWAIFCCFDVVWIFCCPCKYVCFCYSFFHTFFNALLLNSNFLSFLIFYSAANALQFLTLEVNTDFVCII